MPDNLLGNAAADEQFFLIPYKRIAKYEYIQIAILTAIFIPCTAVIFGVRPFVFSLQRMFFALLCICAFFCLIVDIIRIAYGQKHCPFEVYWNNASLNFDDTQISLSDIQHITLTGKDVTGKSIYPKYRHMLIKTRQKKYRYWLGSEYGFRHSEYVDFCEKFERLCKQHAIELRYKTK